VLLTYYMYCARQTANVHWPDRGSSSDWWPLLPGRVQLCIGQGMEAAVIGQQCQADCNRALARSWKQQCAANGTTMGLVLVIGKKLIYL
jgi:hypothetical protein